MGEETMQGNKGKKQPRYAGNRTEVLNKRAISRLDQRKSIRLHTAVRLQEAGHTVPRELVKAPAGMDVDQHLN
jgi:hypothetical protein